MIYQELTKQIIGAFFKVNNHLGYGFLEKVYEYSMVLELRSLGLKVEKQKSIKVYYKGKEVGDYYADLIVNNSIIVEIKTADKLCVEHEYQLVNYLRATNIEIGLLMNFGKKAEFKRKIYSNNKNQ